MSRRHGAACALAIILAAGTALAGDDELASANAALNAEYAKVVAAQTSPKDRLALRAVERAWIAYKERQCAFEGGVPQSQPMWRDCELRLTKIRTDELSHLICPGIGASVCNPH